MSHRADPRFLPELQKYGAANIESCFNCGNCTAVCPLSTDKENFPAPDDSLCPARDA